MYAVISTGGKQYRFEQGDLIKVEALNGAVGDQVVFEEVLALGDGESLQVGTPLVDGAQVVGTIVEQGKASKVTVLKFKRRKMYRRKRGHRQLFTAVKIDSISSGKAKAKKKADTKATTDLDKKQPAKKAAKKPKAAEKKASSAPKAAAKKTSAPTSSGGKKTAESTRKTTRKAAAKTEPGAKKTQE
jgi:large subunit ribosomal protein L21